MSPTKFHDDDFDHHQRSIRKMIEINGHRPSPLKINKDSHVIHKVSSSSFNNSFLSADHDIQQQQQQQQQHQQQPQKQQKQPVIIYTQSPKIIHTQPKDFMALVQKLTGLSDSSSDHHETAPNNKAQAEEETMKKTNATRDDHVNDSSSVAASLLMKPAGNHFLADMPLFTPTSTDNFFCSPRPAFRFPENLLVSPNTGNPISPSFIEFMKGLPEG